MAITLNNGFKMPIVGLGVWRMEKKDVRDLIINAINLGYRHFDCTTDYQNEAEVGEALEEAFKSGLVKREELFITTKLWNSDYGHVLEVCQDRLKKLRLEYLDLYLIHFPVPTKHTRTLSFEGLSVISIHQGFKIPSILLGKTYRAFDDKRCSIHLSRFSHAELNV